MFDETPQEGAYLLSVLVQVEQEVTFKNMASILRVETFSWADSLDIAETGLMRVQGLCGREVKFRFHGCLSESQIQKGLKSMKTHTEKTLTEHNRIESKNALERLLRLERVRQVSPKENIALHSNKVKPFPCFTRSSKAKEGY